LKLLRYIIFITFTLLLTSVGIKALATSNIYFQQNPKSAIKQSDTVKKDTAKVKLKKGNLSGLDDKIEHFANDSTHIDKKNGIVYFYGKARVIYDTFELDAEYIRFDTKNKIIFARGITNDKGKYVGRPIFKMGPEGSGIADSISYNTETKKGTVDGVFKEQEGGFFSGGRTKVQPDNEFHVSGTTYSTCNLPIPHYGLHITKGIATENLIVAGPLYFEFEQIPMPLGLPFGIFPKPNKKSSGIILPTPGEDATKGFSLTNGGYYIALNDYWDAKITGDIYTNGSYHLNLATNYTKRYKFGGNFNLAYASDRQGLEGTPAYNPQKNFHIGWTHSQNANARPGTTFSASVNAGSSNFNTVAAGNNGIYDINTIAQNTLSSSIAYGKVFGDGLFNLTAALSHSQETQAKTITLTLPQVSLNMSTLTPFYGKNSVGDQKWYQKITIGYSLQASNTVNTKESMLFDKDGLKRFKNGFQHSIPISLPFNLLNYLNFNTSVNYNERWYFQTINNRYIKRPNSSDSTAVDTVNGFKRAGEYTLSMGMSTKLYYRKTFANLGKIKGLSHVMTPNFSFSYKPDFSTSNFGYYKNQVYYTDDVRPGKSVPIANDGSQILKDNKGMPLKYSIFEQGIYGGPSAGKQASVGFSLDNNVEIKVASAKDTTGTGMKKIPIIQGLTFSSSYNFVADSMKLAPISFGGRSQFTDKLGFNFSGSLSPYAVKNVGSTIGTGTNQTVIPSYREVDSYRLPRLTNITFSTDFSFNPEALKSRNKNVEAVNNQSQAAGRTPEETERLQAISRDPNAFVDFNIPWNISLSYAFNYSNPLGRPETRTISNTLNFNGDFNLTPKWKIQFNSGYDFKAKNISYTSFAIYRDLHCWDLSANWIPFGSYQSYSIDIKVKASILQDLKLSKRKGYYTKY
jgi:hypothetical protein